MTTTYSPKLIIGVEHTPKNVEAVIDLLYKHMHNCKVGAEAHAYPLDVEKNPNSAPFFNAIGNHVTIMGSHYIPLGKEEDLERNDDIMKKVKKQTVAFFEEKICPYLEKKYGLNSKEYDKYFKLMWDETWDRLLHTQGYNGQLRDNTFLESIATHQPRIIVVGVGHLPPILLEYPTSSFEMVVSKEAGSEK